MSLEQDETLQVYVEESLEHLADIENDFLAIEQAGEDIDEELVNKVYRAAHSIKGGAGFMGLTNIKSLTHEMENILGKIRSREMIPNPEIVNILLLSADKVKSLIQDVFNSNDADISEHLNALIAVSEGRSVQASAPTETRPVDRKAEENEAVTEPESSLSDEEPLDIVFPGQSVSLTIDKKDAVDLKQEGKHIYLVEIDLIRHVQQKNKSMQHLFNDMEQTGIILDTLINAEAVGALDDQSVGNCLPLLLLFATIIEPKDIHLIFENDELAVFKLRDDFSLEPILSSLQQKEASLDRQEQSEPAEDLILNTDTTRALNDKEITEMPQDKIMMNEEKIEAPQEKIKMNEEKTETAKKADEKKEKPMQQMLETETSLRVHVSLLDSLMTLAGELVLSRNQLLQAVSSADGSATESAGQRIDLITSELQEAIMKTRMQPIGNVFNKFPRVVRDLARSLGKEVALDIKGKEVELDKTIIEAIGDPLTHLVRNSVDHGIELPEERMKSGKAGDGHIILKAYHEAGQVNIEISDDGKGLDGKKLSDAAVAKGLLTEDQVAVMSEKEKINLIFLPGFSTAEEVTDVSGRGVGMDVVKTNLDRLGGVVDIESELKKGTTIRIKLPLTLAIIPSQIILTGGERYAIPQVNLEELLRIPADQVKHRIEKVGGAEVVRLRGNLLPLIKLADVMGIETTYVDPDTKEVKADRRKNIADRRSKISPPDGAEKEDGREEQDNRSLTLRSSDDRRYHASSALNIVVVSTGVMKYGLVVDDLFDSEEIVVKPLGRHLKHCKGYAGATIMGDGRVALILDVSSLAGMAGLSSVEGTERASEVASEAEKQEQIGKDKQALLLFRSAEDEQFAVPLSQVERIEKIKASDVELVGGKKVLQYRGGSLALFSIDDVAEVKPLDQREDILVIVFWIAGKGIGLMGIGPVDALETTLEIDSDVLKQPGIMGSAVIDGTTTQLVDVYGLVQTINPGWFAGQTSSQGGDEEMKSILIAEDSNFFRSQVKGFIEEGGYKVIEAEDGMIAWEKLEQYGDDISMVVTDIEMPNMDGFTLTKNIREDKRYSHLPVVALTTLAGEEDIAKGKEVGIDDYQIKLDREKLIDSINHFLLET